MSKYCSLIKKIIKNLVRKTNKKNHVKMAGSKTTCPRWHLSQVEHGSFGVPFDQFS